MGKSDILNLVSVSTRVSDAHHDWNAIAFKKCTRAGNALSLAAGAQANLADARKQGGINLMQKQESHLLWMVAALVVLKQHRASCTEILAAFTAAASS